MQARKKLVAEIALQGDDLEIDEVHYSKNDINVLLNGLTEENWKHHCVIFINDALLQFLEQAMFDADGFAYLAHLWNDDSLVNFISPYFGFSFNEASGKLLKNEESDLLPELVSYHYLIRSEYSETAYQKIRVYISDKLYLLRNLSWERFREDEGVLYFIFADSWMQFINELPVEFDESRNELGSEILSVVYRFQRKATWDYLYDICKKLQKLNCSDEVKGHIAEYSDIMSSNALAIREKESGSGSNWRLGFGVVWVIFMVIRLFSNGGCNSNNNGYTFDTQSQLSFKGLQENRNNQQSNRENQETFRSTLASLSIMQQEGKPVPIKTGDRPFSNFSSLPSNDENTTKLLIKNLSGQDAVVLYFYDSKPLLYPGDKVLSVYVKAGGSFQMDLYPAVQPRFYFLFGKGWINRKHFDSVPLISYAGREMFERTTFTPSNVGSLYIDECFKQPLKDQPFLKQSIVISESAANETVSNIFSPANTHSYKEKRVAKLTLKNDGKSVTVKGDGDLYIYLGRQDR
jgi:hypothetical protein